jgi:hypothetical protein
MAEALISVSNSDAIVIEAVGGVMPTAIAQPKFLGRLIFDDKTQTYAFRDGSGRVPEEMRQDLMNAALMRATLPDGQLGGNGMFVLGELFAWKKRLGLE